MSQLSSIVLAIPLLLGLLAGCSDRSVEVRVLAASSLTDALPQLVEGFQRDHPDVSVDLAYGGSQALATQIEEGAPADLFVSANAEQADRLQAVGLAASAIPIARNELVIAVDAASELTTLDDLTHPDVAVALGAPSVPVGALTVLVLNSLAAELRSGIEANVITQDPNVRVVLSRVVTGEADAAFVYRTDLAAASGLRAIDLDGAPSTTYVAVMIDGREAPSQAAVDFLAYLASPAAALTLRAAGFAPIEGSP